MELNNNQEAFFALLRAGLWEKEVRLLEFGEVDYEEVMRFADEQSVVGLVTAGLEHVKDSKIPKVVLLQFVGQTIQIEETNKGMNLFISELMSRMGHAGIYALIVKGQGIAQCYERPMWRSSGDVDFFMNEEDYIRAQRLLVPMADSVNKELNGEKHIAMSIGPWMVELHGSLPTRLIKRIDKVLDKVQQKTLIEGEVRAWRNGDMDVFLPSADNDVIFVFTHILKHFYRGGIGLRQVCDWCRLLWTFREDIDLRLLESRLQQMGLMTEWKAFSALAVDTLGMPEVAMPFYDSSDCWKRKANRIRSFILETGNFGQNRDSSYYATKSYFIRKAISLWRHTIDDFQHFTIFPMDSLLVWMRNLRGGFKAVIRDL